MKHFDAIIIGTGQAGPSLAARFADAGKTVAIIERQQIWRHMREYGMHSDEDARGERLCDPCCPPRRGIWFRRW
jgi:choline dehydrogenase-like flavoprotein